MELKFQETLKYLRENQNLTQEMLADKLKIARSTIAGYETKGKQPTFETLIDMSELFNVSIDYILTGSDDHCIELNYNCTKRDIVKLIKKYYSLSMHDRKNLYQYIDYLSKQ